MKVNEDFLFFALEELLSLNIVKDSKFSEFLKKRNAKAKGNIDF